MASFIPGYEYDIFISYRQKDNKHDGWVTEFVNNLKGELESTFKEEISVYFDVNPHDGLLETHDVDASLKNKLKCLVFIPIISRTYCDPMSFAWEHEFKPFVDLASHDQFGLKVKLPNSNVACRVLPVRVHDLDNEDMKLCESVLGGVLRGIEFIYREPGVNKPLTFDDDEKKNLNNTKYKIQINKVANAVKEIITAIRLHIPQIEEVPKEVFKPISVPQKNNKTKILAGSFIALALIVIGYFLIPKFSTPQGQLEKSIAVLPFINDSPDQENTYFINGIMEEVLNNLQKIKDFRVLSRTSTEQYKGTGIPTIPEIAKKLGVNYIVEGSGQKYGNEFRVRVQLISANNERHLWAESYEKEIRETKDIFSIQNEIAQKIATELKATITPEENQLINKIPTTNLTAYDFYQQGREEQTKYWNNNSNSAALQKAEDFFHKSLKYDSTFALAYSGLAWIYWDKHFVKEYFSEDFMDSVLTLTTIALSHDNLLSEPYTLRGKCYCEIGKSEQAIEEYDKAIKLNPNDWMAYYEKGALYWYLSDLVNTIKNLQNAASINRGKLLHALLGEISGAYFDAGFPDKCYQYQRDILKMTGDSLTYYSGLTGYEFWQTNFNKSIEYGKKVYTKDSTNENILYFFGMDYAWLGEHKESLKYYKKWFERSKPQGRFEMNIINNLHRVGYAYWQNGYKNEADFFFNEQIIHCKRAIELKRLYGQNGAYYDLASIYAFRGEQDKAYKNLKFFNQTGRMPLLMSMLIKTDPLFNSIRNEPEFQQIAKDIEAKYQAEHERVRKWMEENNML